MSRLSTEFQHQANMVNSAPPEDPASPIAGTVELLQQVLAQNQELMKNNFSRDGNSGKKNTNRPLTPSAGPRQGQPPNAMPAYFDKYCWTHGRGIHKGDDFNSKAPRHKEKAKIKSRMDRRNYGCTQ